jgi:uncharacterized protein
VRTFSGIASHPQHLACLLPVCAHRYQAGGFVVNNVQVPGSVIAQSDIFLLWKPRRMSEVTPESLVFLDLITPAPEARRDKGC